jgi:amidohydrolase
MLKEMGEDLKCRVKLIFQAGEEGHGGASKMCKDGVMDDVDMIIAAHIFPNSTEGQVYINKTCMTASSHGFSIKIFGKSCHVSKPQNGIDAIAVANRVYSDIQLMRARELDPFKPVVIGIGAIHGGNVANIVCDEVTMLGTIRALEPQMDELIFRRINEICQGVCKDMGAVCEVKTTSFTPCLMNNPDIADKIIASAKRKFGDDCVHTKNSSMGAEDFSCYTLEKPGALFDITTGSLTDPICPLHNRKFTVSERALVYAPEIFVQFILDNMN